MSNKSHQPRTLLLLLLGLLYSIWTSLVSLICSIFPMTGVKNFVCFYGLKRCCSSSSYLVSSQMIVILASICLIAYLVLSVDISQTITFFCDDSGASFSASTDRFDPQRYELLSGSSKQHVIVNAEIIDEEGSAKYSFQHASSSSSLLSAAASDSIPSSSSSALKSASVSALRSLINMYKLSKSEEALKRNFFYPPASTKTIRNKLNDHPLISHDTSSNYRLPLEKGRPDGNVDDYFDPGTIIPCSWVYPRAFMRPRNSTELFRSMFKTSEVLEAFRDDGQHCFVGYETPNALFNTRRVGRHMYLTALHVPSNRMIPLDPLFGDDVYRDEVRFRQRPFVKWFADLKKRNQPIRRMLNEKLKKNNKQTSDLFDASPNDPRQEFLHTSTEGGDVVSHSYQKSQIVYSVPIKTKYSHLMMPDVGSGDHYISMAIAQLMSLWGRFYSSGLQQLGRNKITVIAPQASWGDGAAIIVDLTRHMPVDVVYLPSDTNFYAKRLTWVPRGNYDIVEPCAFYFLHHWLVPTIVQRIRFAIRNGRPANQTDQDVEQANDRLVKPIDAEGKLLKRSALTKEEHENATPWWPKMYDEWIRNPPERIAILKTMKGAISKNRMYKRSPHFDKLIADLGYVVIPDTSPHDVRMFLINHAKSVLIQFGGGMTTQSYLWGGGVDKDVVRTIDFVVLYRSDYDPEFDIWAVKPLARLGGVNVDKWRMYNQNGLTVSLGAPNPYDGYSEQAQGIPHAWTKMIMVDDLDRLSADNLIVTDEERRRNMGPACKPHLVEDFTNGANKWKSKWVYDP